MNNEEKKSKDEPAKSKIPEEADKTIISERESDTKATWTRHKTKPEQPRAKPTRKN